MDVPVRVVFLCTRSFSDDDSKEGEDASRCILARIEETFRSVSKNGRLRILLDNVEDEDDNDGDDKLDEDGLELRMDLWFH